jgi:hypothetical protein
MRVAASIKTNGIHISAFMADNSAAKLTCHRPA